MRNSRRIAFFVLTAFVVILGTNVFAQPGAPPQPTPQQGQSPRIGVIDFIEVMKAHPKFNSEAKQLQGELQRLQAHFMDQQKKIQEKAKILETFRVGSKEFMETNDAITKEMAEIETEANKKMRDLRLISIKKEYEAYKSIREEVAKCAANRAIVAVVDIRSIEDNPDDPSVVQMSMSQSVIWFHPQVDLTNEVITSLNNLFGKTYPLVVTIDANGKRITNPQTSAVVSAQQPGQAGISAGTGQSQSQQPPGMAGTGTRPGPVPAPR